MNYGKDEAYRLHKILNKNAILFKAIGRKKNINPDYIELILKVIKEHDDEMDKIDFKLKKVLDEIKMLALISGIKK